MLSIQAAGEQCVCTMGSAANRYLCDHARVGIAHVVSRVYVCLDSSWRSGGEVLLLAVAPPWPRPSTIFPSTYSAGSSSKGFLVQKSLIGTSGGFWKPDLSGVGCSRHNHGRLLSWIHVCTSSWSVSIIPRDCVKGDWMGWGILLTGDFIFPTIFRHDHLTLEERKCNSVFEVRSCLYYIPGWID